MADPEAHVHPPTRTPEAHTVPADPLLQTTKDERSRIKGLGATLNDSVTYQQIDDLNRILKDQGNLDKRLLMASASAVVEDGTVSKIPDWSGNDNDFTPSGTESNWKTDSAFGGKRVLDMAEGDYYDAPLVASQPIYYLVVATESSATTGSQMLFDGVNTRQILFSLSENSTAKINAGSSVGAQTSAIPSSNHVYEVAFDGASSQYFLNGKDFSPASSPGTDGVDTLRLGAAQGGGNPYKGQVAFILVLDTIPSSSERKELFKWAEEKWSTNVIPRTVTVLSENDAFGSNDANTQGRQQHSLYSYDHGSSTYQIAVWYDRSNTDTKIARRVDGGGWTTTTLDSSFADGTTGDHGTCGHFLDSDGYLHMIGDIDGDDITTSTFYKRSASPIDSWDWSTTQGPPTFNTTASSAKYTRPTVAPDGTLYLCWTEGSAGSAFQKLAKYDPSAEAWDAVTVFDANGRIADKSAPTLSTGATSWYMDDSPKWGSQGRMHVETTWRNDGGTRDNEDQTHIIFDLDNGKVLAPDGTELTTGLLQFGDVSGTKAVMENENQAAWNAFCGWQLDSNDNPVAVHTRQDSDDYPQYYLYWWDGSAWQRQAITSHSNQTGDLVDYAAPQLQLDSNDYPIITGLHPDQSKDGLYKWVFVDKYETSKETKIFDESFSRYVGAGCDDEKRYSDDAVLDLLVQSDLDEEVVNDLNADHEWVGVAEDV